MRAVYASTQGIHTPAFSRVKVTGWLYTEFINKANCLSLETLPRFVESKKYNLNSSLDGHPIDSASKQLDSSIITVMDLCVHEAWSRSAFLCPST